MASGNVCIASGCASLEPTEDMRVTHSDDGRLAYVECINSRHSWRLHCAGNVWRHVDPDASIGSCVGPTAPLDDSGGLSRSSVNLQTTYTQHFSYPSHVA